MTIYYVPLNRIFDNRYQRRSEYGAAQYYTGGNMSELNDYGEHPPEDTIKKLQRILRPLVEDGRCVTCGRRIRRALDGRWHHVGWSCAHEARPE